MPEFNAAPRVARILYVGHLLVDENTDSVTLMVEGEAPGADTPAPDLPQHTAVVVLDRSGSMAGRPLESANRALMILVDRLDDRDRFGFVAFDDVAAVVIPVGKESDSTGPTDLSSRYLRGLQEASRVSTATGAPLTEVPPESNATERVRLTRHLTWVWRLKATSASRRGYIAVVTRWKALRAAIAGIADGSGAHGRWPSNVAHVRM